MPHIQSVDELNRLKVELVMKRNQDAYHGTILVTVGMGTCGIAAGAQAVFDTIQAEMQKQEMTGVVLSQTGCIGLCGHEPIVEVTIGDAPKVSYGKVTPEMAMRILQEHVLAGNAVEEFVIDATPFPTM